MAGNIDNAIQSNKSAMGLYIIAGAFDLFTGLLMITGFGYFFIWAVDIFAFIFLAFGFKYMGYGFLTWNSGGSLVAAYIFEKIPFINLLPGWVFAVFRAVNSKVINQTLEKTTGSSIATIDKVAGALTDLKSKPTGTGQAATPTAAAGTASSATSAAKNATQTAAHAPLSM